MSQKKAILFHLQHSEISQIVAVNKYAVLNLWKRCTEIEDMGFKLSRRWVDHVNRWGNNSRYMVYSMPQTKKNQQLFKKLFGSK